MSSDKLVKTRFETAGEMREFLRNVAIGVTHGDMEVGKAAVAVKACEVIVASQYSEAKIAALTRAAGQQPALNGALPLNGAK